MSRRGLVRWAGLAALAAIVGVSARAQMIHVMDINPDTTYSSTGSGGRINGIAIDPSNKSVMYAASEYGGLFKSLNGGVDWFRLDGHQPVLTVDVKVNPAYPWIVYATSFYDGRSPSQSGINVSYDNGYHWTHPATAVPPPGMCANPGDQTELSAFGIAIERSDSSTIYVGTSCGLAISHDAGTTWTYTSPNDANHGKRIWDVVSASPDSPDTCGDAGHYYLFNGVMYAGAGLPMGRCSITASPYLASALNLFATVGTHIYETKDGANWTETRTNPLPQGRIPFLETNKTSGAPNGQGFDLWFGDVGLHRVACDSTLPGPSCGTGNSPPWAPRYFCYYDGQTCVTSSDCSKLPHPDNYCEVSGWSWRYGSHVDEGSVAFDPTVSVDACPLLNANDGGVYYNTKTTSPDCQSPLWQQPELTPHALLVYTSAGVDMPGAYEDHLYFATQDNGGFVGRDLWPDTPVWSTPAGGDIFTTVTGAPSENAFYFTCCGGVVFQADSAEWTTHSPISNSPPGAAEGFKFTKVMSRWGVGKYALITADTDGQDGGLFITPDIHQTPTITWTELGNATEPQSDTVGVCTDYPPRSCNLLANDCGAGASCTKRVPCAVYTASNADTFYVQTGIDVGNCQGDNQTDQLWKYVGTYPGSAWQQVAIPGGRGVGVVAVDQNDPNRIIVSALSPVDAIIYESRDGGASWPIHHTALESMMTGFGDFPMKNQRGYLFDTLMSGYHQPSMIAIDPFNPDNLIAGGRDSGVFYSTDDGDSWQLVTDPRNSLVSGIPHIPRPKHAYFSEADHNKSIFVSSEGRGMWLLDVCRGDAFEPDDTSATASTIVSGAKQTRTICGTGDTDWAAFTLTQSSSVTIEAAPSAGITADISLRLFNGSLQQVDFDNGGHGNNLSRIQRSCVTGSALPPGTYYVKVQNWASNATIQEYQLSVDTQLCCGDGTVNADEQCEPSQTGVCCSSTCTFVPVATACDDANPCTVISQCNGAGLCVGLPPGPTAPVSGTVLTKTLIQWPLDDQATAYDVVTGSLNALRSSGGDFTAAAMSCVADETTATLVDHTPYAPAPGTGFFFLVKAKNCSYVGSFDDPFDTRQPQPRDPEIFSIGLSCAP